MTKPKTKRYTPNQIVAWNLHQLRTVRGWTQEEAAERLEPYLGERWSKATFSVAERSRANASRIRQFTADDIVALSAAFGVPVSAFFMPPFQSRQEPPHPASVYDVAPPKASRPLSAQELAAIVKGSAEERLAELADERVRELLSDPDARAHVERVEREMALAKLQETTDAAIETAQRVRAELPESSKRKSRDAARAGKRR